MQRHLRHHAGGHGTAVERIQALLHLGQVSDAVGVRVTAVSTGADDVFGDVGQAVAIGVEQAAQAIGQHEAGHDAHAVGVQRQAAERE